MFRQNLFILFDMPFGSVFDHPLIQVLVSIKDIQLCHFVFPVTRAIHDVKATDLGLSKVRFKAEVDFDGRVVTRSYLEKQDIEQILTVRLFPLPDFLSQQRCIVFSCIHPCV